MTSTSSAADVKVAVSWLQYPEPAPRAQNDATAHSVSSRKHSDSVSLSSAAGSFKHAEICDASNVHAAWILPNDPEELLMFNYTMEHICSYTATLLQPFEILGETPAGLRINAYVTGGEVSGPRLRGRFLPVGGDWLTVRSDGVGILDVRATMETHDGALIYIEYKGVLEFGADGYQRMLSGNPPLQAPIQAAPRLLTAHPDYLWVNRLQCLNVGMADFATSSVSYDVYAVRSR